MALRNLLVRMNAIGCLPGPDYLVHGLPAGGFNTTWFCNFLADAATRGRAARDRGVPSMPVFAYGKTGSSWLTGALSELMDVPRGVISLNYHAAVRAWVSFLAQYPFALHDHLWPTESALRFLVQHGITRVAVHVRDPRQVLLSLVHHNIAANNGPPSDDGEHEFHSMIDNVIDQSAPHYRDWFTGWQHMTRKFGVDLMITSYEMMIANGPWFFRQMLDYFRADRSMYERVDKLTLLRQAPQQGEYMFRNGTPDEWRQVFTRAQEARIQVLCAGAFTTLYGI
jgi:hypothetical protein